MNADNTLNTTTSIHTLPVVLIDIDDCLVYREKVVYFISEIKGTDLFITRLFNVCIMYIFYLFI